MYLIAALLAAATVLPSTLAQATFERSSKRGLVFVPSKNTKYAYDNQIWVESGSDLTWYYNYDVVPSSAYSNRSQSEFEFVPQFFGAPSSDTDDTFLNGVKSLIAQGINITHTLGFNEPDGTTSTGGSDFAPSAAATAWIREVEPLRALGVKTGAPAVTGSQTGLTWLSEFFGNCTSQGTNCTADFIPLHWYGDFQGMASYIGQVRATYPNTSLWMTEYALQDSSLAETQEFFNETANYFDDKLPYLDRYSYFGSFRSDVSNVGPNAAMLTQKGLLTSIGSWYLGGAETNNIPEASGASKTVINPLWAATVFVFALVYFS